MPRPARNALGSAERAADEVEDDDDDEVADEEVADDDELCLDPSASMILILLDLLLEACVFEEQAARVPIDRSATAASSMNARAIRLCI